VETVWSSRFRVIAGCLRRLRVRNWLRRGFPGRVGVASAAWVVINWAVTSAVPAAANQVLQTVRQVHVGGCDHNGRDGLGQVYGDPDLELGFPVATLNAAGVFKSGPGIHVLLGNIDGDPELEIIYTGLTTGYLWAWNHDGTSVPGWPLTGNAGTPYPALGELSAAHPSWEVFAGHFASNGVLAGWSHSATPLPGWPRQAMNYVSSPPALFDVDGDGFDEIFICEEDSKIHGYRANGTLLPGWPVPFMGGAQNCDTPAVVDLDGDGQAEIIAVTGWSSSGAKFLNYRASGTMTPGFPLTLDTAYPVTFTPVGDVDGDGELEIVVVTPVFGQLRVELRIYSSRGRLERRIPTSADLGYGSAPALADLDGDGVPEIVVAADYSMYVWRGNGTLFSGWPQVWGTIESHRIGGSAPAVGDLTGDGRPEIAITSFRVGVGNDNDLRVFSADGTLHPRFPKLLPLGTGAMPAIGDIDLDGRNELVVGGTYWPGFPGVFDAIWAYDLGGAAHGRIEWGQLMGGPGHSGRYAFGISPVRLDVDDAKEGNGNGVLERGEGATVATAWRNLTDGTLTAVTGTITSFGGPPAGGAEPYQLRDASAQHGTAAPRDFADCREAGGDCYSILLSRRSVRPAAHWDAVLTERLSAGPEKPWSVHIGDSFADVPRSSPFYRYVETLLHRSVTTGCSDSSYCPADPATREQMAVFVLLAREGSANPPKACLTPMFGDVPADSPYCRWIEDLARRGVVSGCGGGDFCPAAAVTREQMAVFALRTYDPAFQPPACTAPVFSDVPASSPFCPWIEELARRGVVSGCGGGNYCPTQPVTREQMSVFLSLTFGLTLYSGS
jgi:hypothetical protein